MSKPSTASRVAIACAILAALAGCGSSMRGGLSARASATPSAQAVSGACSRAVLGALGNVAVHVYHEGLASERTGAAISLITHSASLREAVEHGDPRAARAAAQALIATGHMTNLQVLRTSAAAGGGAQMLAHVGAQNALAPLRGAILGAGGAPIGTFVASVWADSGLVQETDGIAGGSTALRENEQSVAGSFALPGGALPPQGTLTLRGVSYAYTSYPASAYPSGAPVRVYLLKSIASIAPLCGPTQTDTVVNAISHVARLIYAGEVGARARAQLHRVQRNQPLLRAVAARDPAATRLAIEGLLNQHIVRLRASAGGRLLSDVGGPYVLGPVHGVLRLNGRPIGSVVLSIQDDEGYKRLAGRLAGLDVLMYMGPRLVKNSLGPSPGTVPSSGTYRYRGRTFRVCTLHSQAFPSGPLRIAVLIPIPYS